MLKRKKIISKVIATAMIASMTTSMFAIKADAAVTSTPILAGSNRYETAIEVSKSGWTTATNAVLINGDKGLVDALTATPYAKLKNAPILITSKDSLTPATKSRLTAMGVRNVDIVGGIGVVSANVENELKAMGITVKRIAGDDRYSTSLAVAKAIDAISDVSKIAVVNGSTGLPDAVSIAAPAATNNMPILLTDPKTGLSNDIKNFINGESVYRSYVVGQTSAVSDSIMNSLPGTKTRLGGVDRHDTNVKVINEFYSSTNLDNIYVAKSGYVKNNEELVDALAVGVLASKNDDPVLIVGNSLGNTQKTLLADKKFTKITQVGNGIPTQSINDIKNTQVEAESTVTSIRAIDYKTVELNGTNLDKLTKSSISLSGNSVVSYTANSTTKATVVFSNAFSGTNTVRITSNLGNTTSLSFTYGTEISTVEASTKEVGLNGVQHLEFTVNNGQKRTIEELKALGWNIDFKSSENIFYNNGGAGVATSVDGKLITNMSAFNGKTFSYEVTLKKGTTTIKSSKGYVDVVDKSTQYNGIHSYKVQLSNNVKLNSSTLVLGETASIVDLVVLDKNNKQVPLGAVDSSSSFTVTSSNTNVIKVDTAGTHQKKLQTMSNGYSDITISNGTISKTFRINVTDQARKQNSIALSASNMYFTNGVSDNLVITIKDQYQDPLPNYDLVVTNTVDSDNANKVLLVNAQKATIAKADLANKTTNIEGKITIPITSESGLTSASSAQFNIRKEASATTNWATVNVHVSNTSNITSKTLAPVVGANNVIDVYDVNDKEVVLDYKEFSGSYLLDRVAAITKLATADAIPASGYYVRSTDETIANIKANGTNGQITIEAKKKGTATIEVYKDKVKQATATIVVNDSTPKITNIDFKVVDTITQSYLDNNKFDVINSLFDITIDSGKNLVGGLTIEGTSEVVLLGSDLVRPILYVDKDSDKAFSNGDLLLGTIDITTNFGEDPENDGSGKLNIPANVSNGEILVRVYEKEYVSSKNPIKTVMIKVNNK